MKILAHCGNSDSDILVQISRYELAKLLGFGSESNVPRAYNRTAFEVGNTFNISEVYSAISQTVRNASDSECSGDSIASIRHNLQKLDKNLEIIKKGILPIKETAKDLK